MTVSELTAASSLDESSNDDDDLNPLVAFSEADDSLFQDDDDAPRRIRRPRTWGIPTFEEQCNGVNTFVLRPDCDSDSTKECVTMTLEHRRHSTGSDLWDAALVLAHALSRPRIVATPRKQQQQCIEAATYDDKTVFIPNVLHNMTVLELGSGTGAVGLYAAKCLGAQHVIMTDLPDNL